MWRKGNNPLLLVGVPTCTVTLEIIMVISQENGVNLQQDPEIPVLGI